MLKSRWPINPFFNLSDIGGYPHTTTTAIDKYWISLELKIFR
jgi:hypothetical protein